MGANQTWAKVIGVVLLLVGIWGFFTSSILGLFGVNTLHNIVHLVTGAIFVWAGFASGAPTNDVNKWLGVVYALVGIVGFFGVLGFLNVNAADNWLHLVIGVVSAWIVWKSD